MYATSLCTSHRSFSRIPSCRGQIAMEYLMIMGFVLAALSPLVVIYYVYTQDSAEHVSASQLSGIAKEVVDAAEEMYYLGYPSQISMRVYIPPGLESSAVIGRQLIMTIATDKGPAEIVETSAVNMSGSFPADEGIYTITIKAAEGYTNLSYS